MELLLKCADQPPPPRPQGIGARADSSAAATRWVRSLPQIRTIDELQLDGQFIHPSEDA